MALEDEVRALTQQVQRMVDIQSNQRPPSGSSSGTADFGSLGQKVQGLGNTFVDAGSKLMSGTATTGDAFKSVSFVLDKFGGAVGNVTSNAISQLGSGIIKVNDTMRETGKFGVTLGQDLAGFNEAVMKGYLTLDEFQGIVATNSQSMAGLGAGMDKSAKAFLGVLADVETTDVAKDLKALGMSSKELADITQLSLMNRKSLDLSDAKSKETAVRAATDLAVQLDLVAQITGKSREQAAADLKQRQDDAQLQAAMALKGPEFAKNFESATAMLPKSAQKLMSELATGGVRTDEGVALSATYGGEVMDSFQKLNEALEHGTEEQVARAREEAMAALVRRNADKSVQETTMLIGNSYLKYGEVFLETASAQRNIEAKQEEVLKATGERISIEEAQRRLIEDVNAKKRAQNEEGTTARTINQVDNLGKTIGAVSAQGLKELNDRLLKAASKDGGLNAFENKLKELASPEGMVKGMKDAGTSAVESIKNAAKLPVTFEGPEKATPTEIPKRANGSLGTVGKWLEDWGVASPVTLHGKEGIVTSDQFKMIGEQFNSVIKTMQGSAKMPNIDLGGLGVTGFGGPSGIKIPEIKDDELNNFISKIQEDFKPLSTSVEDISEVIATGGVRAQEGIDKLAKVAPAADDFHKTITDQSKTIKAKGDSNIFSDVFFGIGNLAGKAFDKATKEPAVPEGFKKDSSGRMVLDMKTPDEWKKAETDKAAIAAFDKKYNIGDVSKLGAGADAAALKAKYATAKPAENSLVGDIQNFQKNLSSNIKADNDKKKKEEEQKKAAAAAEKAKPIVKQEEEKQEEKKKAPDTTTMSDVKEELVKLNTSIRELISHTDQVAEGVRKQNSLTKSAGSRI